MLGYVRFATENPALFRLVFSPEMRAPDHADLREAENESHGVLQAIFVGLIWDRRGEQQSPEREALRTELMLWTFVYGYATLLIEGRGPRTEGGGLVLDVLDVAPEFEYAEE